MESKHIFINLWVCGARKFSITSEKDNLFRPFVIPAKSGIQANFEPLLDSGFRRNDVMNPDFLRSYRSPNP